MAQHDDRIKRWLRGVEDAKVVRQMSDGRWAIQVAGRKQETWVPESILRSGDDGVPTKALTTFLQGLPELV